jgi:membrane protein required for colicin V production
MTVFDYVLIGIVAISLLLGLWRGVIGELIALAAWAIGVFGAAEFGGRVGEMLYQGIADPTIRMLAGCVTVFVGVLIVMALLRMAVKSLVKALGLSVSDRLLGSLFGLARGLLICMVLVALGGMTSAPQQPWWQDAKLSAPFETAVLVAKPWLPEDLAKRIRFS